MESMIQNLLNGNLKDAKRQAKKFAVGVITDYLHHDLGWTTTKSVAAADYLKTGKGFQEYCDAE